MSSNNPRAGYEEGPPPQPVPDPVQKRKALKPEKSAYNAPKPPLTQKYDLSREKVDRTSADLQILTSYVSQLQDGLTAVLDSIQQLRTNLKLTIRAVERLAKGKSLGALGLPGEEEWKESK